MLNVQKKTACGKCGVRFKTKNLQMLQGVRFCKKCAQILIQAAYRAADKEYDRINKNGLVETDGPRDSKTNPVET